MASMPRSILKTIPKEEALAWGDRYEESKLWLGRFAGRSKLKYARALMRYCAYVGVEPPGLIELKKNQRNHEAEKLLDWFVGESPYPDSSMENISVAVKSYYKWNYEDLARACGRTSYTKQKSYRTPTQRQLATFILGAINPRDKALIHFMAATRVREETVCRLDWSHVWGDLFENPRDPQHIGIMGKNLKGAGRGTYRGLEQHTFLTPDAKQALLEYKEWREARTGETITPESPLFTSITLGELGKRLQPVHVIKAFQRASRRSRLVFSAHDMGRFTRTQLEAARVPENWIKKIIGHKVAGEENPYSRPKIEQLRKEYRKAIPFLSTQEREVIDQLRGKMERLTEENRLLQERVNEITSTPLLQEIVTLLQLPGGTEFFSSLVDDAKKKLDEMFKLRPR